MIELLRDLYEGQTERGQRFRAWLLAFDILTLVFIVGTSFTERGPAIEAIDVLLGILILLDLLARFAISRHRGRELLRLSTWTDVVAIVSFLAPLTGEAAGFLRVLRTLRILHTYTVLNDIKDPGHPISRNEEVILAIANLGVFVFVMTAIVYETQHWTNPDISNYADALYFTVTALTTTGFGDITLPGTLGRMLTVLIMIFGVTLFLRLAQVLFRPNKVRFACPTCGLLRHDPDAVHCKACGTLLNIPNEGTD
ncbi:potassium channel family protein [Rubellimicrobium arenae]|uniref:potassium channel family protein n=1 Tax=Rubellimicrobium arenae TaxID=2817372 RepID=UPI001B31540A|nr:potassium channel family protein [Rubellimicrobium arenae]